MKRPLLLAVLGMSLCRCELLDQQLSGDLVVTLCQKREKCAQESGSWFDPEQCLVDTRNGRDAAISKGCMAEYDEQAQCQIGAVCGTNGTSCGAVINTYLACYQSQ